MLTDIHYHIIAVCRDHSGGPIENFRTFEEALNFVQNAMSIAIEKFGNATETGRTPNTLEFNTTDPEGLLHEMQVTWFRHSEGTFEECEEFRRAQAALVNMAEMLRSAMQNGMNIPEPPQEAPFDDTPFDFSSLDNFLRDGGA